MTLFITVNILTAWIKFQRQSTEMTDACSKLPPTLFDMPYCQLIRWFASLKDSAMPGPLSELFGQSATGRVYLSFVTE